MRYARLKNGEFLASKDGESWVAVSATGDEPWRDTRDLIAHHDSVREQVERASESRALPEGSDLMSPIGRPGKILAIGMNYLDHAKELEVEPPAEPLVFAKYPSSVTGPESPIRADRRVVSKLDYEAELAVVVGKGGRWIPEENALDAIFGYCIANDVSARDYIESDSQFSRSKGMDTFCPTGPWITGSDETDPSALALECSVNGVTRQSSSTQQLLFSVPQIIAYLSRTTTLEPGDVILTGTPAGVGHSMSPPSYLEHGDLVECSIEGLGSIRNRVQFA